MAEKTEKQEKQASEQGEVAEKPRRRARRSTKATTGEAEAATATAEAAAEEKPKRTRRKATVVETSEEPKPEKQSKAEGEAKKQDGNAGGPNNAINDKTGRSFPILREEHCRSTLYNAEKLWLADKMDELQELGLRWLRLNFTTENSKEIEAVIQAYRRGEGSIPERATRGLYYRGVQ